jgi:demethylmenaquinone methyltransferase/2-methoxy-6-polyprenyl-1,4-benzoquinol methylase
VRPHRAILNRDIHDTSRKIFRGLAKSYDWTLDFTTVFQDRRWKDWLISEARLGNGDTILDVGCGTCVLEERLEELGYDAVGLDLTPEMLRLAKRKGLPCVQDLLNGDAEHLPFLSGSFDVAFSCYVVKYCDTQRFCSELARVLRPGGRLLMYDFARPRGLAGPVLATYAHGILPLAGRILAPVRPGIALTFRELPRIIEGSGWFGAIPLSLARSSLEVRAQESLSGGVVEAFSAMKRA